MYLKAVRRAFPRGTAAYFEEKYVMQTVDHEQNCFSIKMKYDEYPLSIIQKLNRKRIFMNKNVDQNSFLDEINFFSTSKQRFQKEQIKKISAFEEVLFEIISHPKKLTACMI